MGCGHAVGSASKGAIGGEHFGIVEDFVALKAGKRPRPLAETVLGGAGTLGNDRERACDSAKPAFGDGFLQGSLVGKITIDCGVSKAEGARHIEHSHVFDPLLTEQSLGGIEDLLHAYGTVC
jgi:hypothetical protein